MDQEKKDFFISYTGADQQWAEWIAWQLEDAGYTTVLQAWDFHAGSNFVQDMHRASIDTPDIEVRQAGRDQKVERFLID